MKLGKSLPDIELDKRLANLAVNQGAILVYTSGTTGNPKGVMLSHDAVTFAARLLGKQTGIGRKEVERQVQYMPVNHAGASGKKSGGNKVPYLKRAQTKIQLLVTGIFSF